MSSMAEMILGWSVPVVVRVTRRRHALKLPFAQIMQELPENMRAMSKTPLSPPMTLFCLWYCQILQPEDTNRRRCVCPHKRALLASETVPILYTGNRWAHRKDESEPFRSCCATNVMIWELETPDFCCSLHILYINVILLGLQRVVGVCSEEETEEKLPPVFGQPKRLEIKVIFQAVT